MLQMVRFFVYKNSDTASGFGLERSFWKLLHLHLSFNVIDRLIVDEIFQILDICFSRHLFIEINTRSLIHFISNVCVSRVISNWPMIVNVTLQLELSFITAAATTVAKIWVLKLRSLTSVQNEFFFFKASHF